MKAALRRMAALAALIAVTTLSGLYQGLHAAEAAPAAAQTETFTVAPANKESLSEMSKAMKEAQDHFLALYNKVNRNTDHRVSCSDMPPTGSRLSKRSCSTRSQTRVTEEQARGYISAAGGIADNVAQRAAVAAQASTNAQAGVPLTAEQSAALSGSQVADTNVDTKSGEATGRVSDERQKFEKNLQELLAKNPELRQRYEDYLAARQRYLDAGGQI